VNISRRVKLYFKIFSRCEIIARKLEMLIRNIKTILYVKKNRDFSDFIAFGLYERSVLPVYPREAML